MAQQTTVTFIDGLTGEEIAGDGGAVQFGLDGTMYEIDLSAANKDELREAPSDYFAAGRKISGTSSRARARRSTGERSGPDELAKIRAWAKDDQNDMSSRGRIAQSVRDAYPAAN